MKSTGHPLNQERNRNNKRNHNYYSYYGDNGDNMILHNNR